MRQRVRMFLLVGLILIGGALPLAARAAQSTATASSVTLANESATRATAVSPPMIDAPVTAAAATDQPLTLTATATDPDAADVLSITATGAPPGLSFGHTPSVSPATATLSGTLGMGDIGSWMIRWEVSDGTFTAGTTTALTVTENRAPTLDAPSAVPGAESVEMSFPVLVSDPDGDPVTSLTGGPLPAGATFTPNGLLTSGEFAWTPTVGQQGTYTVTFTAESGSPTRATSATTELQIGPQDLPPVVTGPGTVNGRANHLITFTATCSDPDGEAITLFNLAGAQNTPLPAGAVWTTNAGNTSGTLTWTPTQAQVGTVSLRYKARDAEPFPLETGPEQYTTKVVVAADRAPVVTAPASVSVNEGDPLSVNVTASDPDGDTIASLTASGLPFGATFVAGAGNSTGTLSWTPTYAQAGSYTVTFNATNALPGSATTVITVTNANRAPTADAGGPYSGVAGVPLAFDGTASSDPDGDPLTYMWDFGDGGTGSGGKPNHTFMAGGSYPVTLTVTDNGTPALGGNATTTASIKALFDARVFTTNSYRTIKLQAGKPIWCAQVEPIDGNFNASDVILPSLVLRYGGQEIHPLGAGKTSVDSDTDKNGVSELQACFAKEDLRTLFAGLPSGHNTVVITIEASLLSGALIQGSADVDVYSSGGSMLASVFPNPFNPEGKLSFVTRKPGALRVRLYDLSGRLVRTLADEAYAAPGSHELHIDGRADDGSRLSSGVYFFRIEAVGEQSTGRISILK